MDWFTLNLLSHHLSKQPWMNEANPGFGFEKQLTSDVRGIGGVYKNTEGGTSLYGGINWAPLKMGPLKLGFNAGLLTGYREHPILPAITPTLALEKDGWGVNLTFIPDPKEFKNSAVGLQLKKALAKKVAELSLDVPRTTSYEVADAK